MLATRILYVEDDDPVRDSLAQLLSMEGYDIKAVATAEDALTELRRATYDLLLTDYRLPIENADWLLREAKARGALEHTPVIVLSAERKPEGISGYQFLRKPVDLDVLLAKLAETMGLSGMDLSSGVNEMPSSRPGPPLELTLYITGGSLKSQKAMRNLQRILRRLDTARVVLDVRDVAEDEGRRWSDALDEDRILVTPTLVRRSPLPKIWIVGDLSNNASLEDVLSR
jgi:CheY-like chemotaxis protein